MNILGALKLYCKEHGGKYSVGEDYKSLQWHSEDIEKPTLKQLEEYHEQYLQEEENTKYKKLRAEEYPPIADQLDLIYREGLEHWMNLIQSIKVKYPNPIAPITLKSNMRKTPMQEQIEALNAKMDSLTKKVEVQQLNAKDIQLITDEIKAGMFAIKGFMMEIPNIQKQLNIIQDQIGAAKNHE